MYDERTLIQRFRGNFSNNVEHFSRLSFLSPSASATFTLYRIFLSKALGNLHRQGVFDSYNRAMDAVLSRLRGQSDGGLPPTV